jgi:hypothetical protein
MEIVRFIKRGSTCDVLDMRGMPEKFIQRGREASAALKPEEHDEDCTVRYGLNADCASYAVCVPKLFMFQESEKVKKAYLLAWVEVLPSGDLFVADAGFYGEGPETITHNMGQRLPVVVMEYAGESYEDALKKLRAVLKIYTEARTGTPLAVLVRRFGLL